MSSVERSGIAELLRQGAGSACPGESECTNTRERDRDSRDGPPLVVAAGGAVEWPDSGVTEVVFMNLGHLGPDRRARLRAAAGALAAALLLLHGCGGDSGVGLLEPGPDGALVGASDCKERDDPPGTLGKPGNQDCIVYDYDGNGRLRLTHVNTAFNCCPEYVAEAVVEEGTILLREREIEGMCACLCLYDLEYEITGLEPGAYDVVVRQEYLDPRDPPLEFRVRLISAPSGEHCVERSRYPWLP
jgi:hypothetical protein